MIDEPAPPPATPPIDLHTVFDAMVEMVVVHELVLDGAGRPIDYRILACNAAFTRVTGIERSRAIGELASVVYGGAPPFLEAYAAVATSGVPAEFDAFFAPLDKHFQISVVSWRRGQFTTIATDTTTLHRALAQASSDRERLAVTLRSIGDGVVVADAAGAVTMLNEVAEELTGWRRGEALGRPFDEVLRIVHAPGEAALGSPFARVLREERVVTLPRDAVLLARDGTRRPIADSAAPIRDRSGRIDGVVMVFRDGSAERRMEQLLAARISLLEFAASHPLHELMQRTLDALGDLTGSPIGFFHFVEPDQRTLSLQAWSTRTEREFCHATGAGLHYPIDKAGVWVDCVAARAPVIHNDYASLPHRKGLPPGHAPVIRELVVPVIREDRVVAILGVGNKATDYDDDDARVVSYLADTCWEMTARKRAEDARAQLEVQLAQSRKLESIGRLAGGIAHDFNNLLTVILSNAECLREDLATGAAAPQDVAEIQGAAQRAKELTSRLLAFARQQTARPIGVALGAALTSIETLLRRVLGDDIELRVSVQTGLWPILIDAGQLEQVLLNLAANGRDAMADGGVLTIQAVNATVIAPGDARAPPPPTLAFAESSEPGELAPGDWVRLRFTDTGVGMSPETVERLFEPFFTTKEVGRGTGLGLATVHGIVTQAGGHVHVTSAPGQGTTFEICFPRAPAAEAAAQRALEPSLPQTTPRDGSGGHETVLVVEDDDVVRGVTVRSLRNAGFHVLEEGRPADALDRLRGRDEPVHAVVSDVRMPGLAGPAMVKEMRRIRPDLRVLFMSGYPGEAAVETGHLDAFLEKPFTTAQLVGKLRALLDD